MTKEQLKLLFEYIDVVIAGYHARDSEDGGLYEIVRLGKLRDELFITCARSLGEVQNVR
jgi:hypothetical protein